MAPCLPPGANLAAGQPSTPAYYTTPMQVVGLPVTCEVAARNTFSVIRGCNGSVWTWGLNVDGQWGDGTTTFRRTPVQILTAPFITSIASGSTFGLAIGADDSIVSWGRNSNGQLGDGTDYQRLRPTSIGAWLEPTPTLSVVSGTHGTPQTVTVASADTAAAIHRSRPPLPCCM
jgi:alpha-tubulin suppressor-like RCC1 family protein